MGPTWEYILTGVRRFLTPDVRFKHLYVYYPHFFHIVWVHFAEMKLIFLSIRPNQSVLKNFLVGWRNLSFIAFCTVDLKTPKPRSGLLYIHEDSVFLWWITIFLSIKNSKLTHINGKLYITQYPTGWRFLYTIPYRFSPLCDCLQLIWKPSVFYLHLHPMKF